MVYVGFRSNSNLKLKGDHYHVYIVSAFVDILVLIAITMETSLRINSPEFIPGKSPGLYQTVRYSSILSMVNQYGGSVMGSAPVQTYVDETYQVEICCANGHTWHTPVLQIREWCTLCKILAEMHKVNPTIYAVHKDFDISQVSFEFKCGLGHWYISSLKKAPRGCLGCELVIKAAKRHGGDLVLDQHSLIVNDTSRIRMHCFKLRHDPLCKNPKCVDIKERKVQSMYKYDPKCNNYVCCDQDFYATPSMLKNKKEIYICDHDHTWIDGWEIINTVRLFEIYFKQRFDDPMIDQGTKEIINVTGYNRSLAIAFTHLADSKCERAFKTAQKYCHDNNIHFIWIETKIVQSSKLANYIFEELSHLGIIQGKVIDVVNKVRAGMRLMSRRHKLLETRVSNQVIG